MIRINEKKVNPPAGTRIGDMAGTFKPGADLFIVNGFPVPADTLLKDGDVCCVIAKGETPCADEMESLLIARHTPGVHEKIKTAAVGIMGLGGLGSQVAVALARIGVGRLLLVDYDVVEPSNLNRQQYFIDQIGMKKTAALKENLLRINPYVEYLTVDAYLSEETIPQVFKDVDVVVECFDNPETKASALRARLVSMPDTGYVASSGLAGFADNNSIRTRKIFPKVFIVGDGETAASPGQGLMAPRVGIAAHHQANQTLRVLLGLDE